MAKKAPPISVQRDLAKDIAAAKVLKQQLAEMFGEQADADLLRDSIEGETSLFETIDLALSQIAVDEANIDGIKKFSTTIAARKSRLENRVEALRTMILNVLDMVGDRKLERPLATITAKVVAPSLTITDEAAIPAQFWKSRDPELDRTALSSALKSANAALSDRLEEINARLAAGQLDAKTADEQRQLAFAGLQPIPGAELSNGGATVQIRWS